MTPRRPPLAGPSSARARALVSVVALTIVVGCGPALPSSAASSQPSPSAAVATPSAASAGPTESQDLRALYASIEEQVRAIRGLEAKSPVDPKVLDDAGIKKLVSESFTKDNPPEAVAANERLLKAFGLLPADASLEDLYIELLGSQVAGLYSPDDKQLYVVAKSGRLGPAEKVTFAHEYTHALQDQNFDLSGLKLDEIGEGDRGISRLSLVEGDATLVMSLWQLDNLSQEELFELLGQSLDPEATKILTDMPAYLRETLLFPYTTGLSFTQGLYTSGGFAGVDAAFAKPPASTEQVIHPDKYAAGEAPMAVDLPNDLASRLGAGWKVGLEDTLGEEQLSIWLRQAASGGVGGTAAAAGWGGDRVILLDGPEKTFAVALSTEWDTKADAAEFAKQAQLVVNGLDHPGGVLSTGGTTVSVVIASTNDLVGRVENVLGLAG
ncbi:MAG TPA: hypothetical protein VGQ64_10595 [Candidatus Limnocylindrales bacterium]|nr:hypothetical protein [Candidatus Limnocylindrales bacterium]